jgi:hypothetical protein
MCVIVLYYTVLYYIVLSCIVAVTTGINPFAINNNNNIAKWEIHGHTKICVSLKGKVLLFQCVVLGCNAV